MVVSTRASGAEAQLSFAGLIDLLDGVDLREPRGLAGPPARGAGGGAPARGTETVSRPTAARSRSASGTRCVRSRLDGPLLVAVDDLQWLDAPSGDALAFAARRLDDSTVFFVLARRPGRTAPVERALAPLKRMEVGPLSLGATRRMLAERLDLSLQRQLLRRIVDATLGNPLFALELGRSLGAEGLPAIGEELPVPDAVEHLLGRRVVRLSGGSRRLLLAVALSGDLREGQVAALADLGAARRRRPGGRARRRRRSSAGRPPVAGSRRGQALPRTRAAGAPRGARGRGRGRRASCPAPCARRRSSRRAAGRAGHGGGRRRGRTGSRARGCPPGRARTAAHAGRLDGTFRARPRTRPLLRRGGREAATDRSAHRRA